MAQEVLIEGDGGIITIEALRYERTHSPDAEDANWIIARCAVRINHFSCDLPFSMRTHDLHQFSSELNAALISLKGLASFQPLEGDLHLSIRFGTGGRADVSGIAKTRGPYKSSLSFAFGTDQSFLSRTQRQLSAMMSEFSIRGGKTDMNSSGLSRLT